MNVLNTLAYDKCCEAPSQAISPSLVDQFRRTQLELKDRLERVTAALDALEKNPEVCKVLELIARAR